MRGSKCQSTDLVPLSDKKLFGPTPTKQNSDTFLGFFSKFPRITLVTFIWESPPPLSNTSQKRIDCEGLVESRTGTWAKSVA